MQSSTLMLLATMATQVSAYYFDQTLAYNQCANDVCWDSWNGYWYCCDYWYSTGWAIALWVILGLILIACIVCCCVAASGSRQQRDIYVGTGTTTKPQPVVVSAPQKVSAQPGQAAVMAGGNYTVTATAPVAPVQGVAPAPVAPVTGNEVELAPVEQGSVVGSNVGAEAPSVYPQVAAPVTGKPVDTV